MKSVEPFTCSIPLDELESAEESAFRMLGMDREAVMDQFDDIYEDTLAVCLETFDCKALAKSFSVDSIDDEAVNLEGGIVLQSSFLAKMLKRADEVVLYAVTVHGFEELANNPENDMFESMFYNAWGVGYSMSGHAWVKNAIAERARAAGKYAGRGWTPGEEELELSLQETLFDSIEPSQIGITLQNDGMMSPIMTVSGIMGISTDPEIENDGAGLAESH